MVMSNFIRYIYDTKTITIADIALDNIVDDIINTNSNILLHKINNTSLTKYIQLEYDTNLLNF